MKRGQVWTIDFTLSLFIFLAAIVIAYTFITNITTTDDYDIVKRQASDAAQILNSQGYPQHWVGDTLIRSGIVANNRLSLRKARENFTQESFMQGLRLTDTAFIYAENETDVVPIFGTCGVGDLIIPPDSNVARMSTVGLIGPTHEITDQLNITLYDNQSGFDAIREAQVIFLEGNVSESLEITSAQLANRLHDIAQNGRTIVIIGDPGTKALGITFNYTNATTIDLTAAAPLILLNETDTLNISQDIPIILSVDGSNYQVIGTTDTGYDAIATWLYGDSRVWFFPTSDMYLGTGEDFNNTLVDFSREKIDIAWPDCSPIDPPEDAEYVAKHTTSMVWKKGLIDVHVLVWRGS